MNIRYANTAVALLLVVIGVGCKKSEQSTGSATSAPAQSSANSTGANAPAPASAPVDPAVAAAALRPPQGAKLAIVVFEDLQCPACSQVEPLLEQAAKTYKIPLVRHDFVLPSHSWSGDAHLFARYFDTQSPTLGEAYRQWIFENQRTVTKSNLRQLTDRFAAEHKTALPMMVDPNGQLAAKIKADGDIGRAIGINQTPTIYIVSTAQQSASSTKVEDRDKLFSIIDQMKSAVEAEAPGKKAKTSSQGAE